jgi:hypothetical protein
LPIITQGGRRMAEYKAKPYSDRLKEMMAEKSRLLSRAETLAEMGLPETAQSLWASVASHEERIAPLLEVIGRDAEAALHRVSAASCYERTGELSRAANLYRACRTALGLRQDGCRAKTWGLPGTASEGHGRLGRLNSRRVSRFRRGKSAACILRMNGNDAATFGSPTKVTLFDGATSGIDQPRA